MRPIANFTLHAILAAALAALAATSAAAAPFDAWLQIDGIRGETEDKNSDRGGHIELQSYSFGASRHSSDASAGRGASNEMRMEDRAGSEQAAKPYLRPTMKPVFVKSWSTSGDAAPVGATETLTVGSGRTESASGQATGKRTHKPLRATMVYDAGGVTLGVRMKGCKAGASYPKATIFDGVRTYELHNVVIAGCGTAAADDGSIPTESISLNFDRMTVRGWDPAKKEN